jgi:hypothetical protein
MSYPSYPKKWHNPEFQEVANYLVENGVKMPLLEKIGLFKRGEDQLFQRYIRDQGLKPTRGRQSTNLSIKNRELRRHLLTALSFYHRQDLASALQENALPRAIIKAYQYFTIVHNTVDNGTKLTLELFVLAVTNEEIGAIEIDVCSKCSGKYIRSSSESTTLYKCIACEDNTKPIFTGILERKVA